jgi:hypothetical protein
MLREARMKFISMSIAIAMVMSLGLVGADILSAQERKTPQGVIVANPDTYEMAKIGIIKFLEGGNVRVVRVGASEFENYKSEPYIIFLGGPNEPEGIGDLIKELLTPEELAKASEAGNEKMFIKDGKWAKDQYVMVFAGADKNAVRNAIKKSREQWSEYLASWFDIRLSITDIIGY